MVLCAFVMTTQVTQTWKPHINDRSLSRLSATLNSKYTWKCSLKMWHTKALMNFFMLGLHEKVRRRTEVTDLSLSLSQRHCNISKCIAQQLGIIQSYSAILKRHYVLRHKCSIFFKNIEIKTFASIKGQPGQILSLISLTRTWLTGRSTYHMWVYVCFL